MFISLCDAVEVAARPRFKSRLRKGNGQAPSQQASFGRTSPPRQQPPFTRWVFFPPPRLEPAISQVHRTGRLPLQRLLAGLRSGRRSPGRKKEPHQICGLRLENLVAFWYRDPGLFVARPEVHRGAQPRGVIQGSATYVAHRRAGPRSADPRTAFRTDPPDCFASAIGKAMDRFRLAANDTEGPLGEHTGHRESAAGHPLAIGAVAGIDHLRWLGDLEADRAALATTRLRELHRPHSFAFDWRDIGA